MSLCIIKGDLFSILSNKAENETALAHCVSQDLCMGAGIAVIFKKKFGRVSELKSQNGKVCDIINLKVDNRHVFYLITKELYYHKPTYQSLENCLLKLYLDCKSMNINKIAMPKIGCGLDLLAWPKVENILNKIFIDIQIIIYDL